MDVQIVQVGLLFVPYIVLIGGQLAYWLFHWECTAEMNEQVWKACLGKESK